MARMACFRCVPATNGGCLAGCFQAGTEGRGWRAGDGYVQAYGRPDSSVSVCWTLVVRAVSLYLARSSRPVTLIASIMDCYFLSATSGRNKVESEADVFLTAVRESLTFVLLRSAIGCQMERLPIYVTQEGTAILKVRGHRSSIGLFAAREVREKPNSFSPLPDKAFVCTCGKPTV